MIKITKGQFSCNRKKRYTALGIIYGIYKVNELRWYVRCVKK